MTDLLPQPDGAHILTMPEAYQPAATDVHVGQQAVKGSIEFSVSQETPTERLAGLYTDVVGLIDGGKDPVRIEDQDDDGQTTSIGLFRVGEKELSVTYFDFTKVPDTNRSNSKGSLTELKVRIGARGSVGNAQYRDGAEGSPLTKWKNFSKVESAEQERLLTALETLIELKQAS